MRRFEATRTAHAPRAVVWDVLTDVPRTPRWLTVARQVDAPASPQVGSELRATGGALGVEVELRPTVAALERPSRYGWRFTDPVAIDIDFHLEEAAGPSTRIRATVSADLGRRPSVRLRVAVRVLRGELETSLDRLVALSESAPLP